MATQTVVPADGIVSFVVPSGVTTLTVDAVGGAGGAYTGRTAGKGGRVKCDITVTPGETLSVRAGAAGVSGSGGVAGGGGGDGLGGASSAGSPPSHGAAGGGGSSGVRRSSTMLVVGPGGGGSGRGASGGAGGDGGTPSGSAGGSGTSPTTGGGGGTSSAGGAAGTKSSSGLYNGAGVQPATQQAISGGGSGSGFNDDGPGGGGGGGYYGGGAGGNHSTSNSSGGGGGGSGLSSGVAETIQNGVNSGDGYVTLTWTVPSIANCSTVTFTPGNTVGASHDQPAVYSSSASLDTGFGTNRTPAGWPATGALIKAVEVELTVTDEFTGDGEVQVGVFLPNDLLALPGATSDASAAFTGWTGEVREYVSGFADAYWLDKFGGWRTDYMSPTSSIATSNTLSVGIIPAFGQDWAIEFEARRTSWASSNYNTVTGSGATPVVAATSTGLWIRLAGTYATWAPVISWATLGAVDGQWLKCRITYSTASRLNVYVDNGSGWTLVATPPIDSEVTYTETPTKWGAWYVNVGNGQNASGIGQIGWDGDIRSVLIYSASTLIMDLGLDRMPTSTSYDWATTGGTASWFGLRPTPPRVTGATIPDTKRVRVALDAPCSLEDFRLIVDAQTGALTVDEILLEAACFGGIYVDGAVH